MKKKLLVLFLLVLISPALFAQGYIRITAIEPIQGTVIKSIGETSGKVLTANGSGAATWTTMSFLPLAGGTLVGALTGTSATFSGDINVNGSDIFTTGTDFKLNVTSGTSQQALRVLRANGWADNKNTSFLQLGKAAGNDTVLIGGGVGTALNRLGILTSNMVISAQPYTTIEAPVSYFNVHGTSYLNGAVTSTGTINSTSSNGWAIGSLADVARIDYVSTQFRALNAANGFTGFKGTTFESTATGVPPFTVAGTHLVTNLNSDMLDGQHGSYFSPTTHTHKNFVTTQQSPDLNTLGATLNLIYDQLNLASTNLFPSSNNANAVLTIGTYSDNNYAHQLGFSGSGEMYQRIKSAGTWGGTWYKIFSERNSNSTSKDWNSNINNSLTYNLNGLNINTANTLSNVAYKGTLSSGYIPYYDGTDLENSPIYRMNSAAVTIGGTGAYTSTGSYPGYWNNSTVAGTPAGYGGAMFTNDIYSTAIYFIKSRGTTIGTHGAVASADRLGVMLFEGSDGTNYKRAAQELVEVDGTVSTNIVPSRFAWYTTNSTGTMAEKMRITSAGNVGIGTTAPSEKLEVSGNLKIVGQSHFQNGSNAVFFGADINATTLTANTIKTARYSTPFYTKNDYSTPYLWALSESNATENKLLLGGGSANGYASTYVSFLTAANTTTPTGTERMRITSAGNVGINNTAPSGKLDIIATTGVSDYPTLATAGLVVRDDTPLAANTGGTILFSSRYNSGGSYLHGAPYIRAYKENATADDYQYGLKFGTRGNVSQQLSMTLTGNGHLLIGKSTDGESMLQVYGTASGSDAEESDQFVTLGQISNKGYVDNGGVLGQTNYVTKFSDLNSLEASQIFDNGVDVGIGTTAPNNKLSIHSTDAPSISFSQTTNGYVFVGAGGGLAKIKTYDAGGVGNWNDASILFQTHSSNTNALSDDMIIRGGNVGIGTVSPARILDIKGANPVVGIEPTTLTQYGAFRVNNNGGVFVFGREASTSQLISGSTPYAGIISATGTYPIQLGVNNAIAMTVLNGGNVGIGTTAPEVKFQIGTELSGIGGTNKTVNMGLVSNYSTAAGIQYNVMGYFGSTVDNSDIFTQTGGETAKNFFTGIVSDASYFNSDRYSIIVNGAERLSMPQNGNVGIGTTAPGVKLAVTQPATISVTLPALGANGGTFGVYNDAQKYGIIMGTLGTGISFIQNQRVDGTATAYNLQINPNGGNVEIGSVTADAAAKLLVGGKTKTTTFQMTTGAFANYVLTSDASGNASWSPGATGAYLPLAGGTLTGDLAISKTYPTLTFNSTINSEITNGTKVFKIPFIGWDGDETDTLWTMSIQDESNGIIIPDVPIFQLEDTNTGINSALLRVSSWAGATTPNFLFKGNIAAYNKLAFFTDFAGSNVFNNPTIYINRAGSNTLQFTDVTNGTVTLTDIKTAINNEVTTMAVTGSSTKTITLTQRDLGTVVATFTDNSGSSYSDVYVNSSYFSAPNFTTSGSITFSNVASVISANLNSTTVTPASYTNANITVGSDGRITAASNGSAGGSMTWPAAAGIAVYAGSSSWGTSITDNSAGWNTAASQSHLYLSETVTGLDLNIGTQVLSITTGYGIPTTTNQTNWSTAYTDRLKWDGGATGLVAATGRTSLGGTTVGQNMFILTNPGAITFPRFNADNTVTALSAASLLTALGSLTLGNTSTTAYRGDYGNTAYTDRLKWDGGSTGLVAATGRTSLGATTVGNNIFISTNPSAITFLRANADNTVTWESASTHRTSIGAGTPTTLVVGTKSASSMGITSDGSADDLLIPNFETTTANCGLVPGSNNVGATYFLNGSGTWSIPAGGGTPGGSATQVQYNNGGTFAGSASFTYASGTGIVTATNFQLGSDRRYKRGIQPIGDIDWIDKVHFKSFYMKNDSLQTLRYGVIAQELEKINPNFVSTNQEGYKAVSYIDLLIAKVARQDEKIKTLENYITKFEKKNEEGFVVIDGIKYSIIY